MSDDGEEIAGCTTALLPARGGKSITPSVFSSKTSIKYYRQPKEDVLVLHEQHLVKSDDCFRELLETDS